MSPSNTDKNLWFTDRITEHEKHAHGIKKWIIRKRTKIQNIAIAEFFSFGRCLIIDDDIQSCELDEFIYHEALVHPAMVLHGSPSRVLILGGGEGATLREVLKHKTVKKVTMVDIDRTVIDLCRKYMPGLSARAFDDGRAELVIEDAIDYVAGAKEQFDVIISDLSSPIEGGPAYLLYTKEFYSDLRQKLAPNGIFSAQIDSLAVTNLNVGASICRTLRDAFPRVKQYGCYIPSFDSIWGFVTATNCPVFPDLSRRDVDLRITDLVTHELKFYDGETHEGIFALPKYLRTALNKSGNVITAKRPVFIYK